MKYQFAQLDPRPGQENPDFDLGIEVTESRLLGGRRNLDHHGEGTTADTPSAAMQALLAALPGEGSMLATIRPDMDSVTAMAVLELRANQVQMNDKLQSIVAAIDIIDRKGPQAAGEKEKSVELETVAIARIASNFRESMAERVEKVAQVLLGTFPREQMEELMAERDKEREAALAASKVSELIPGKLVLVESTHRFATGVGYEVADTVIAVNPEMAVLAKDEETGRLRPTGETYVKFTVCRRDEHVETNLQEALRELQSLEQGWGGRGDIFGSPQNRSSQVSVEEVVDIVKKYVD